VSDSKEHEKRAIAAYCSVVRELIKKDSKLSTVKAVNIWTDGPSSQFKNKYIFNLLPKLSSTYGLHVCWNYFATSHGKGPVDALGGNVKRLAHRQVLSRQTVIVDAVSFGDAVRRANSNILIFCMPEEEIATRCRSLCVDECGKMPLLCEDDVKIYHIPDATAIPTEKVATVPVVSDIPAEAMTIEASTPADMNIDHVRFSDSTNTSAAVPTDENNVKSVNSSGGTNSSCSTLPSITFYPKRQMRKPARWVDFDM